MKILPTFLLVIFISFSVFAKTCLRCLQEFNDDEIHICFDEDQSSDSEVETMNIMSSEEEMVGKRGRDDYETEHSGCKKFRRDNSQIELQKPKLCKLDLQLISATHNFDFKNPVPVDAGRRFIIYPHPRLFKCRISPDSSHKFTNLQHASTGTGLLAPD